MQQPASNPDVLCSHGGSPAPPQRPRMKTGFQDNWPSTTVQDSHPVQSSVLGLNQVASPGTSILGSTLAIFGIMRSFCTGISKFAISSTWANQGAQCNSALIFVSTVARKLLSLPVLKWRPCPCFHLCAVLHGEGMVPWDSIMHQGPASISSGALLNSACLTKPGAGIIYTNFG